MAVIDDFLATAGWADAARAPLAGDASFRRYLRLSRGPERAVLMIAGPPNEDVRPYLAVARWLGERGFSAPQILAGDAAAGLVLLEDLGDESLVTLLARDAAEPAYGAAAELLAMLHRFAPPSFVAPFDDRRMLEEGRILLDWYLPARTGAPSPPELYEEYAALWRAVLPLARQGNPASVLIHRDYFADNLMWLAARRGIAQVGLLDFQDAVAGPAVYDLASLLKDARRALPAALAEAALERYIAAAGIADRDAFLAAYAVIGAQRNARIAGLWPRLWKRDQKPGYLRFLPNTWRLLEADLAHPALAALKAWFDRVMPPESRRQPLPGAP